MTCQVPERAVVIGAGASGEAAARLLAATGSREILLVDASDGPGPSACAARLANSGVRAILGPEALTASVSADLAVISPGIDPRSPLAQNISGRGIPMIAEIELAYRHAKLPVVAITGTNGKTTTTELVTAIINASGPGAVACGNIGLPFSTAVLDPKSAGIFVVETSSFQLEGIVSFRPKVAAWLNFSPDHLDRHASIEEYRTAKLRIFENQTSDDFAVVNAREQLPPLAASTLRFGNPSQGAHLSIDDSGMIRHADKPILDTSRLALKGAHNHENLMAALGCAVSLGIDPEGALSVLETFQPGRHRLEFIAERSGVRFLNDSKSTNPDSLARALEAVASPVILIAGGKDKGFDFKPVAPLVRQQCAAVFLIGETAGRIASEWPGVSCRPCSSLAEAVSAARDAAMPDATVLFSPGTSSFDMFRDYADRGDQFRTLVLELNNPTSTPR